MAENNNYFGTKALLVSRVSTQDQVLKDGFSPQQNDLEIYAKEVLHYTDVVSIDTVESGFLDYEAKEGWNAIERYLENHKDCRTIIATEFTRIARNDIVLMQVKDYLIKNKIQLIIKDYNYFLYNPDGTLAYSYDLMFNIFTSMSKTEMLDKKERQYRGLREYRKQGYSIGGKELFGYTRVCDGGLGKKYTYDINKEQQKQIIQVYEWYAYGINNDLSITSLRRMVIECKQRGFSKYLCSQRNLNKCLKEQAYIGKKETHNKMKNPQYWNYGDKSAPKYIDAKSYICIYKPLLDKDLFYKVQERLSQKNTRNRLISNNKYVDISHKHITLLSKIVKCPICGSFLTGDYRIKDGFNKHTYRCAKSRRNIEDCAYRKAPSMLCLDSAIWSFLKTKVTEINAKKNAQFAAINQEDIRTRIVNLQNALNQIEEKYDNLRFLFLHEVNRDKEKAKKNYAKGIIEIDKEKEQLEKVKAQNERLLYELQERETKKQQEKELEENILKISNDKSEMYKYIHLLIKTVKPLLTTNRYTVLEVVTFDNVDEVLDYGKEDFQGLPVIKAEKHDNMYYICLDKLDNHRIKARLITSNTTNWIIDGEYFCVAGDDRHFSVEDIFTLNPNEEDPTKYCGLTRGFEELDYQPLNVYNEDMSHQKISIDELEKMASEATE